MQRRLPRVRCLPERCSRRTTARAQSTATLSQSPIDYGTSEAIDTSSAPNQPDPTPRGGHFSKDRRIPHLFLELHQTALYLSRHRWFLLLLQGFPAPYFQSGRGFLEGQGLLMSLPRERSAGNVREKHGRSRVDKNTKIHGNETNRDGWEEVIQQSLPTALAKQKMNTAVIEAREALELFNTVPTATSNEIQRACNYGLSGGKALSH